MPSPTTADSAFVNQIAWRLAAGIAAGAALIAVILTNSKLGLFAAQVNSTTLSESPAPTAPVKVTSPAPLSLGGDGERAIAFCADHVTPERCFVVFSNGTCVIVDEPSTQPMIDAIHTLVDCAAPDARFITREIQDGHHLVTYRRAVFHCVFAEEIAAEKEKIQNTFRTYLTSTESRSAAPGFEPPLHAKIGLVARARLNLDAQEPAVIKVIRAKPIEQPPPQPASGPDLRLPELTPDPYRDFGNSARGFFPPLLPPAEPEDGAN